MGTRYYLTEQDRDRVQDLIRRDSPADQRDRAGAPPVHYGDSFWAKITSGEKVTDEGAGLDRWQYAWTEQERTEKGFQDKAVDARSGTTTDNYLRHAADPPDKDAGVLIQVPNETIVRVWQEYDTQDEPKPAWTFRADVLPPNGLRYQCLQRPDDIGSAPVWDYVRASNH